jgi:hypothetical protein
MNRALATSLLIAMVTSGCTAQKNSPSLLASSATVHGRVFLITRGGDLKPARMANVYLLRSPSDLSEKLADVVKATTEAKRRGAEVTAAGRVYDNPALVSAGKMEYEACAPHISGYERAIQKEQMKDSGILVVQSDEEGNFGFDHVPSHEYFVTAIGGAGSYIAIWQSTENIAAGQKLTLKLSSPVADCPTVY